MPAPLSSPSMSTARLAELLRHPPEGGGSVVPDVRGRRPPTERAERLWGLGAGGAVPSGGGTAAAGASR